MRKILLILFFLPLLTLAQPANYWTNSFNTEASLLSGAVVGGNAGITAIFYNPAGISDIKESRFDLNASLFNVEHKVYDRPLGKDTKMDNWTFRLFPRFTSYVYQSKRIQGLTYQFAILNRNSANTIVYNRVQIPNSNIIYTNNSESYTGLFELSSQYDDYWGSLGVSKIINERWSIGIALNISVQSLSYFRSATANAVPEYSNINDSIPPIFSSSWSSYERIRAYNWRFIGKIGLRYRANNWSAGLNISLPSIRLFGDADVNKTISQSNILYQGSKIPDYYTNEYPQYVYFKMPDPLSIAFGWMYNDPHSQSEYFVTMEYFASITKYLTIDASKATSETSILGTDYSSYEFANRQIIKLALGYKKMLSNTLGFMAGFRTDFNPYPLSYNEKHWETSRFEALNINLYHITGGVKFDYKKSSFVVGLQHSFGSMKNQKEFINFSNPNSYNPDTKLALQGDQNNDMNYQYNSLGFYLGFSIAF